MVDCPHLERAGYGGDGNSSTQAFQTMYDAAPTYMNWLQAWGDVMHEDGGLPHVCLLYTSFLRTAVLNKKNMTK